MTLAECIQMYRDEDLFQWAVMTPADREMTDEEIEKNWREKRFKPREGSGKELNLNDKETLVNLLFKVQTGHVSCRQAATYILEEHKGW